jgi:hypothetical protein
MPATHDEPHAQYVLSYEELKAALKTHQLVSIKWRGLLIFWAIVHDAAKTRTRR